MYDLLLSQILFEITLIDMYACIPMRHGLATSSKIPVVELMIVIAMEIRASMSI